MKNVRDHFKTALFVEVLALLIKTLKDKIIFIGVSFIGNYQYSKMIKNKE